VVRRAARAGLTVIALTDHDTVAGVAEAATEGRVVGVEVVPACELSVQAAWGELHLLVYAVPVEDPDLRAALDRARSSRADRGRSMVESLNRLGVPLSLGEVDAAAGSAPLGRPHVARALIAKGVVGSFAEAFDRFLGRGRPAFVPKRLPPFAEVAELVRRVGGVSSAAHLGPRGTRESLGRLRSEGLDAVEVHHPSHTASARKLLDRLAAELGLLRTGGSDWHGAEELSPSHSTIGAEAIPVAWVDAIRELSRRRKQGAA
jgi:predicted metal-dependent phosphoesterase TrpH